MTDHESPVHINSLFILVQLIDYVLQISTFIAPIYVFYDDRRYYIPFFVVLILLSINRVVFLMDCLILKSIPKWYYTFFWITRIVFSSSLFCVVCIVISAQAGEQFLWTCGVYGLILAIPDDTITLKVMRNYSPEKMGKSQ
uniref:7TM_GPCR_Srx domain-containing protein n=1 Tax=Steinernema glaseri TaxID=37863 RepID=A0A1I7Z4A5_9BILA